MLGIAQFEGKRETHMDSLPGASDDSCSFELPSQMELAVSWNGRERSFAIAEDPRRESRAHGCRSARGEDPGVTACGWL